MSNGFSRRQLLAGFLAALFAPFCGRSARAKQAPASTLPATSTTTYDQQITTYSYDAAGQLTSFSYGPLSSITTTIVYNGRCPWSTDGRGRRIT